MYIKNKLLIIGAGGLGRMTLEIASSFYDCYFVDDAYQTGELVCGIKIVGHICDLSSLSERFGFFVVSIGDNKVRELLTCNCLSLGMNCVSIVSPLSYVSNWSKLGIGSIVMPFATIHNGACVGKGTVLCSHVEIHHDASVGDFCVVYPNTTIRTYAKVGDRVKCGSNVSIGNESVVDNDSTISNGFIVS